ncbi:hypothetical protein BD311DRAFT_558712 [Dichomitus squalens]|uniref:Uncharacterized protein n=1 Tax=Dichomitus squalens TaxID=114155 RepID=A0A4Q9MF50_9APHY|nr:hypothetical protein BD311DRAFT_558712 [Dichomitus squalens]
MPFLDLHVLLPDGQWAMIKAGRYIRSSWATQRVDSTSHWSVYSSLFFCEMLLARCIAQKSRQRFLEAWVLVFCPQLLSVNSANSFRTPFGAVPGVPGSHVFHHCYEGQGLLATHTCTSQVVVHWVSIVTRLHGHQWASSCRQSSGGFRTAGQAMLFWHRSCGTISGVAPLRHRAFGKARISGGAMAEPLVECASC